MVFFLWEDFFVVLVEVVFDWDGRGVVVVEVGSVDFNVFDSIRVNF